MWSSDGKQVKVSDKVVSFSWQQVVTAFWRRYPNPYSKHVLTEDVVDRKVILSKDGPLLRSVRLLTKTNSIPKWGEKLVPSAQRTVSIIEESLVDPVRKILKTKTRNIGLTKVMYVEETVVYTMQEKHRCLIDRRATVKSDLLGLATALQTFGAERFKHNASKANKGLEYVLNKLYTNESLHVLTPKELLKQTAAEKAQKAKEKVQRAVASNTS
ncbi:unnamed protein product [Dimorphilus gyrociliatus]|uniref:PRELI/MSF1 domain-containing protein n=1 Tax=Dimorphilus gyrociliatus TaxID=2664684 RepID=A0A7I8VQX4_9ANNE|nr:unnamed protein product [Dimorphilus gyrociliatus]